MGDPTVGTAIAEAEPEQRVEVPAFPFEEEEVDAQGISAVWRYRGWALMAVDVALIVASFLLAFAIRSWLQPHFSDTFGRYVDVKHIGWESVAAYFKGALLLAVAWVVLIWRAGGYESGLRGIASPIIRIRLVLLAGLKAFAVVMVLSYMYRGSLLSRPVYAMTAALALGNMILARLLFLALDRDLAVQGLAIQHVVVGGLDQQGHEFANRLNAVGSTVRVAGFLTANGHTSSTDDAGYPVLGHLDEIADIYEQRPFDKLVLSHSVVSAAQDEKCAGELMEIVNFCEACNVTLYTLPNVLNVAVHQSEVGTFAGMPLVKVRDAALHRGYAAAKRIMDLVIASTVLLLGSPLWLAIAAFVKYMSKGPIIFRQTRVGLHGVPFRIYKFRSMVQDAEARLKDLVDVDKLNVPGFKLKGDPRVTWIGAILRRTSLDEIPQLLNVLKGEMSIVGPRPEMPNLVQRYNPWQRRRLKAKPGITGYQQIMARGQPLAGAIEYDLIYLKHQSLLLDLYILLKTVIVVFKGTGVTH